VELVPNDLYWPDFSKGFITRWADLGGRQCDLRILILNHTCSWAVCKFHFVIAICLFVCLLLSFVGVFKFNLIT